MLQHQGRDERDEIGIAAALAQAVERALHLARAGAHRGERVGDGVARCRYGNGCRAGRPGTLRATSPTMRSTSCGKVPPLVSHSTIQRAPAVVRRLEAIEREAGIGLVAVEEMLGVEQRLVEPLGGDARSIPRSSPGSRRGVTPSATSTWKSQVLPTRQSRPRAPLPRTAARPGSLAALRPRAASCRKRRAAHGERRRLGEERVVGRIGAGPAALDIVDAEQVQLARDAILSGTPKSTPCVCAPSRSVVS